MSGKWRAWVLFVQWNGPQLGSGHLESGEHWKTSNPAAGTTSVKTHPQQQTRPQRVLGSMQIFNSDLRRVGYIHKHGCFKGIGSYAAGLLSACTAWGKQK